MNKLLIILLAIFSVSTVSADPVALDQLLNEVKRNQGIEGKINQEREARFLAEKAKQQSLLAGARADLSAQERLSAQLKQQLEANEQALNQLQTELDNRSGILKELSGVAKQAAGDLKADFENSLISAQYPGRTEKLAEMATGKALPSLEQLESLWFFLQQEMTESGKVVRFNKTILTGSGDPREAQVVRIGSFNAVSDGQYLRYLPETGKLAELARQPDGEYTNLAEDFANAKSGEIADIGIDPTRGVILSLLIQTPNLFERIDQGGAVGYVTIILGLFGLIYAIYRLIFLSKTDIAVNAQVNDKTISEENPLGRIIAAAELNHAVDVDTLQLIIDEAITREVPVLEKGLSMIKLLAAVAPLLGLLGTVTGMISTFQSISLFGTGDPKLMASGISQALVTTMIGLCVAVPLLFLHSLMAYRSRSLIQILDEQSAGIISRRAGK
ncbi:MAG: MotA/TolQ/ExbB proton channel family protein [Methylicorpusculum sp.]|uniref:MotA/TolQ/ExbB proton channel family protein n=1 Tax=Methylicorpusculum sp. TaxID=2713644 RepID=UPI00271F1462|nr:MotA/TolQ/ExbB proton channel family protein [Methylicorpusculum sp.]MDO8844703.1 MotA/TolQ/ExbB proton channel family protein [Methylicorpusculum sp.]MDO8938714.1 MotA/TolQ/ExbB proton channel family protein [Methylicorpusculum sp.]MDP2178990.1 MotA/TolQ/ExbB proton channel family protein [Methylicorpusculum sp.]MDP2201186.1 MotA/TolQ/ExbB proton channel family protein [Methylicorpusculum sp.]MDP3528421.1 MotA/TolQ/ExbB proton channel family protein [Methylicorpusculum sp.]